MAELAPVDTGGGIGAAYEKRRVLRIEGFSPSVPLAPSEQESYSRRFTTLFADDSATRIGGHGHIFHAANAWGDSFACKVLDEEDSTVAAEYRSMCLLSGDRSFPRVYGAGRTQGHEVMIMEWVEGATLERAMLQLSLDEDGRLSPLTAARIGRDLFGALARMDTREGKVVHGDISLSNVMLSTSTCAIEQQTNEGAFDIRLVDFGSSCVTGSSDPAIGSENRDPSTGATAAFAAPELLREEGSRATSASDVYAAAGLMCAMLTGKPPFAQTDEGASLYKTKMAEKPSIEETAHSAANDIPALLAKEPEVAVDVGFALSDMGQGKIADRTQEIREALIEVDSQLLRLVADCMDPNPRKRPSAQEMHDALDLFCESYSRNIAHALHGEQLEACTISAAKAASKPSFPWSSRTRAIVRNVGKAASAAIWIVAVVSAGLLAAGRVPFAQEPYSICGILAIPLVIGYLVRANGLHDTPGFLRGSICLLVAEAALAVFMAVSETDPAVKAMLLVIGSSDGGLRMVPDGVGLCAPCFS